MRLSSSLKKNVLEAGVGRIFNRFKIKGRRDTLFFEDILANYFKEFEDGGYKEDSMLIGQKWGYLIIHGLVPGAMKKLGPSLLINTVMERVWTNLGLMDYIHFSSGEHIKIKTRNEGVTRIIGPNSGMMGFHTGILNALYGVEVDCIRAEQRKDSCTYLFSLTEKPFSVDAKPKELYNKLNYMPEIKGFNLKNAIQEGAIQIKGNKLFFRGKFLCPIENTIFHLISNKGIMIDCVSRISYTYFDRLVEKESTIEKKLNLLKNLLQVTGWGVVKIVIKSNSEITVDVNNPPHGLQPEKDNWDFLLRTIQGYLWLINPHFEIEKINEGYKKVSVDYAVDGSVFL